MKYNIGELIELGECIEVGRDIARIIKDFKLYLFVIVLRCIKKP